MASTSDAARLTEIYRLAQTRLGALTVQQITAVWPLLDLDNLDESIRRWLAAVVPIVETRATQSATLAVRYYSQFRALEAAQAAPFTPIFDAAVNRRALITSMTVTGPYELRAGLGRGLPFRIAQDQAQAASAGAAMRHALDGGRNSINRSVEADTAALGYSRAAKAGCCAFCAMLASRGPVYKTAETAGFQAHDNCSCTPEPVFTRNADWPPNAREFQTLWKESTRGYSGKDAVNAFRRAFDAA